MNEDYIYGDEYINSAIYIDDESAKYFNQVYTRFLKKYNFLPIEDLSMSTILIFKEDELEYNGLISNFQSHIITEKYKSKNLVDLEELANGIFYKLSEPTEIELNN